MTTEKTGWRRWRARLVRGAAQERNILAGAPRQPALAKAPIEIAVAIALEGIDYSIENFSDAEGAPTTEEQK